MLLMSFVFFFTFSCVVCRDYCQDDGDCIPGSLCIASECLRIACDWNDDCPDETICKRNYGVFAGKSCSAEEPVDMNQVLTSSRDDQCCEDADCGLGRFCAFFGTRSAEKCRRRNDKSLGFCRAAYGSCETHCDCANTASCFGGKYCQCNYINQEFCGKPCSKIEDCDDSCEACCGKMCKSTPGIRKCAEEEKRCRPSHDLGDDGVCFSDCDCIQKCLGTVCSCAGKCSGPRPWWCPPMPSEALAHPPICSLTHINEHCQPCECCQGEHCLPNYMCKSDSPLAVKPCECGESTAASCIKERVEVLEGETIGDQVQQLAQTVDKCMSVCENDLFDFGCVAATWSVKTKECTFFADVKRVRMSSGYKTGFLRCEDAPTVEEPDPSPEEVAVPVVGWMKDGYALQGVIASLNEDITGKSLRDCLVICTKDLKEVCKAVMWGREDKACLFYQNVTEMVKSSNYDSVFVDEEMYEQVKSTAAAAPEPDNDKESDTIKTAVAPQSESEKGAVGEWQLLVSKTMDTLTTGSNGKCDGESAQIDHEVDSKFRTAWGSLLGDFVVVCGGIGARVKNYCYRIRRKGRKWGEWIEFEGPSADIMRAAEAVEINANGESMLWVSGARGSFVLSSETWEWSAGPNVTRENSNMHAKASFDGGSKTLLCGGGQKMYNYVTGVPEKPIATAAAWIYDWDNRVEVKQIKSMTKRRYAASAETFQTEGGSEAVLVVGGEVAAKTAEICGKRCGPEVYYIDSNTWKRVSGLPSSWGELCGRPIPLFRPALAKLPNGNILMSPLIESPIKDKQEQCPLIAKFVGKEQKWVKMNWRMEENYLGGLILPLPERFNLICKK